MIIQEIYTYPKEQYDGEGVNIENDKLFLESIRDWEEDFHEKHPHCYANYLLANDAAMKLIDICLDLDDDQHCGMDLIDGKVDVDANMEMETYSKTKTVYALGSQLDGNEEEPIFLIIDDSIADGVVYLKYVPDEDREREDEVPVEGEKINAAP